MKSNKGLLGANNCGGLHGITHLRFHGEIQAQSVTRIFSKLEFLIYIFYVQR